MVCFSLSFIFSDAEALSSKNAEKADDGWADKEEKKKVVVSSGKGLASLQSLYVGKKLSVQNINI